MPVSGCAKWYAVRSGRKPGIYSTWPECVAQIRDHPNAEFQAFELLRHARSYLCPPTPPPPAHVAIKNEYDVLGPGPAPAVDDEDRKPVLFNEEFDRLAASQGWDRGSRQYAREWTNQLGEVVWRHYFLDDDDDEEAALDGGVDIVHVAIKREPGTEAAPHRASTSMVRKLRGFQRLCREVGVGCPLSIPACKAALGRALVNIVDLVDAKRARHPVVVWADFADFRDYTLTCPGKRINPREVARDEVLRCFLQRLKGGGRGRPTTAPDADPAALLRCARPRSGGALLHRVTHGRVGARKKEDRSGRMVLKRKRKEARVQTRLAELYHQSA